jgi:nitrile hydratase accessory protein
MTSPINPNISNMQGELAMPRRNGEPVFETPWEARAFGMAVALNEKGIYPWGAFSQELAAEIAAAEQHDTHSTYYERWYAALEKLAEASGLVTQEEVDQRAAEYASGMHDDHHDHDHGAEMV